MPHQRYKGYDGFQPGDININVNYPQWSTPHPSIYATSLTDNPDLSDFDAVAAISQYAKEHTNLPERTVVVPLGVDYPPNVDLEAKLPTKVSKQCFYASSPDRGLDVLLEAWPQVYAAHPDATLILTYGAQTDLPGVICLGDADDDTMAELYATSDIWCHPCTGVELFCLVGKKAQAAGCIPVIIPHMALAETVQRGFKTDREHYAQTLIEVLDMPFDARNSIRRVVAEYADAITWQQSTEKLLVLINNVLQLQSKPKL